jgi:ABC-type branched-subunit amino acid transport system permease subunit
VGLLLVPAFAGPRLPVYTNALAFVLIFLSLGLLVWTSGQISLCQAGFAAVGATTFAHLTTGAGIPWLPALLLAGLATIPLGVIVALPAIRLSGVFLALATFGFGILVEKVAYRFGIMFGGDGFRVAPRPHLGFLDTTSDKGFYYFSLFVAVIGCLLVVGIVRSRLGRLLRALGDSPAGLESQGLNINSTRVLVFALSSFLAGIGGVLFISGVGTVNGNTLSALNSLIWLAVLIAVRTRKLVPAAFLAAAALSVLPVYMGTFFNNYATMIFGVAAVAATLAAADREPFWKRLGGRTTERTGASPVAARTLARRAVHPGLTSGLTSVPTA